MRGGFAFLWNGYFFFTFFSFLLSSLVCSFSVGVALICFGYMHSASFIISRNKNGIGCLHLHRAMYVHFLCMYSCVDSRITYHDGNNLF